MELGARLNPVTKAFLAGSLSGTCSTVLFQPLDLVKTRQQAAPCFLSKTSSMLNVVRNIVATDTIMGLWRGMVPSLARTVPGVGLYFSSMHWMKSHVIVPGKRPSTLQTLIIGASARTFAASTMIPFTVLKTRFESGNFHYKSLLSALGTIARTEGMRGMYRGLVPTLVRDVPFSGLYLACYEALKSSSPLWLSTSSPAAAHALAGLGAGLLASLVTHPADVVKTKMQLAGLQSPGVIATVRIIHRQQGITAFTVGLAPRLLRRTSMVALAWTVYEKMLTTMALK